MWKELTNKSTVPPGTVVKRKETWAWFKREELYTVLSCLDRAPSCLDWDDREGQIVFRFDSKEWFPENFLIEIPDEILESHSPILKGSVVICNTNYYSNIFYWLEYIVEEDSNNTCSTIRIDWINLEKKNFNFLRWPITVGDRVKLTLNSIYSGQNYWVGIVTKISTSGLPVHVTWDKLEDGQQDHNSYWFKDLELVYDRADIWIDLASSISDTIFTSFVLDGKTAVDSFKKWISEQESHIAWLRYNRDDCIPVGTIIKRLEFSNYLTVGKTYCVVDSARWTVYVMDDKGVRNGFYPDKFIPVKKEEEVISPYKNITMATTATKIQERIKSKFFTPAKLDNLTDTIETIRSEVEKLQEKSKRLDEVIQTLQRFDSDFNNHIQNENVKSVKEVQKEYDEFVDSDFDAVEFDAIPVSK